MRKFISLILSLILYAGLAYGQTGIVTKGPIGEQDLSKWDGVTGTFTRGTSTGGTSTLNKVGYEVDVLIVYGGGVSYTNLTISKALTAVGTTNQVILLLRPGIWVISSNLTIPANITLKIPAGAMLFIDLNSTLAVNGNLDAGLYKIFDIHVVDPLDPEEVGKVDGGVTFGLKPPQIYTQWWGSGAIAFQSAMNTRGNVYLPNGSYTIGSSLDFTPGGVSLSGLSIVGESMTGVILNFTGTGYLFQAFNYGSPSGTLQDITLSNMTLQLGTSGTGIFRIGNPADTYGLYSNLHHEYKNLQIYGDSTVTTYRAGTYGIINNTIQSSVFENVTIHNFETIWVQYGNTENVYIKCEWTGFNNGVYVDGPVVGGDNSTFNTCGFHGPLGTSTNGYALKVNNEQITTINCLFEPTPGYASGSGNVVLWIAQYGGEYQDYGSSFSVETEASATFTATIQIDAVTSATRFMGTKGFLISGLPGIVIAAPAYYYSRPVFIGCSNEIGYTLLQTPANAGRYILIGQEGSGAIMGSGEGQWALRMPNPIFDADFLPGLNATYYLGRNTNYLPRAWKGVILKDTTNNHYYRIEVINGVLTATDLGT